MRQSAPRRPACRPLEFFRRSAQGTSDGSGRYGRAMHAVRAIGLTEPGPSAPSDGPNRLCRSNGSGPTGAADRTNRAGQAIEPPDRQARRAARNARAMPFRGAAPSLRRATRPPVRAQHRRTPRGHRPRCGGVRCPALAPCLRSRFPRMFFRKRSLAGIAFRLLICHGRKIFKDFSPRNTAKGIPRRTTGKNTAPQGPSATTLRRRKSNFIGPNACRERHECVYLCRINPTYVITDGIYQQCDDRPAAALGRIGPDVERRPTDRAHRPPADRIQPRTAHPKGRCCIHKERAVWKYKSFPLLGFDMSDEKDELTPLSDYARRATEGRDTLKDNILCVIDEACSACVKNNYVISNLCRGCVARSCMMNCPKGAIEIGADDKAHINHDKCVSCGICHSSCPYHAVLYIPVPCEEACPRGRHQQGRARHRAHRRNEVHLPRPLPQQLPLRCDFRDFAGLRRAVGHPPRREDGSHRRSRDPGASMPRTSTRCTAPSAPSASPT